MTTKTRVLTNIRDRKYLVKIRYLKPKFGLKFPIVSQFFGISHYNLFFLLPLPSTNRSSVTKPLREDDHSIGSLQDSDTDSMTDYEGEKSKFEEDGSFIGQYGARRKSDMPPILSSGVATFV